MPSQRGLRLQPRPRPCSQGSNTRAVCKPGIPHGPLRQALAAAYGIPIPAGEREATS